MATVINNPSSHRADRADQADGASDLVIGIIAAVSIIILILFLVYGLPALQGNSASNSALTPGAPNTGVSVPSGNGNTGGQSQGGSQTTPSTRSQTQSPNSGTR